jgi:hypothetical protein
MAVPPSHHDLNCWIEGRFGGDGANEDRRAVEAANGPRDGLGSGAALGGIRLVEQDYGARCRWRIAQRTERVHQDARN